MRPSMRRPFARHRAGLRLVRQVITGVDRWGVALELARDRAHVAVQPPGDGTQALAFGFKGGDQIAFFLAEVLVTLGFLGHSRAR